MVLEVILVVLGVVLVVLGVVLRQCSEQMFGTDSVRNSVPSLPGDLHGRHIYQNDRRNLLHLPAPLQDPNFELQRPKMRKNLGSSSSS